MVTQNRLIPVVARTRCSARITMATLFDRNAVRLSCHYQQLEQATQVSVVVRRALKHDSTNSLIHRAFPPVANPEIASHADSSSPCLPLAHRLIRFKNSARVTSYSGKTRVHHFNAVKKRRMKQVLPIRRSLEVTSTSRFLEALEILPRVGREFPGKAYFAFFSSSHLAIKASRAASLFLKAVSADSIPRPEQFSEVASGTPPQLINKMPRPRIQTILNLKFIYNLPLKISLWLDGHIRFFNRLALALPHEPNGIILPEFSWP